jgi:predicted nucleic acid-binding protein
LVDTNVFIHAHTTDAVSEECRSFLRALEAGTVRARIEPLILHELSYALPHYVKQMTRQQVGEYLLMVLSWDGITGDKLLMADVVERWRSTPRLSFADAYLAALAAERGCEVYTKNVRELRSQGASVPEPLPDGS